MQRKNIVLSDEELEAIWLGALQNKYDLNHFKALFSQGLYEGINQIQNDAEVVKKQLYIAAKEGHFDQFKRLFEKGVVDINERYHGKTLLYVVIKSDTQPANHEATIGRKKIASYLLDNGADITLRSYGLTDEKPSPLELCEQNQRNSGSNTSWRDSFFSMFLRQVCYGSNIFPILQAYHKKNIFK